MAPRRACLGKEIRPVKVADPHLDFRPPNIILGGSQDYAENVHAGHLLVGETPGVSHMRNGDKL
jgi:hypothetical protein